MLGIYYGRTSFMDYSKGQTRAGRLKRRPVRRKYSQQRMMSCELVAPGCGRSRDVPLGICGQKSRGVRNGNIVSVIQSLNSAQEMLSVDLRKGELRLAVRSVMRLREKQNKVGVILLVDEKQNPGLLIAEARDSVFAGGKSLAGGHEWKRHFHEGLICGLGLRGHREASEAGQNNKNAQE